MNELYILSKNYGSPLFTSLILAFLLLMSSCKDDDNLPAYLAGNTITITDIVGIPSDLTFDRIKADIQGTSWKIIGFVEAPYEDGKFVLTLPTGFSPDVLQQVERTKENKGGCWAATLSDPDVLVASLGDTFVYNGDVKVGRVYLTDWSGEGSSGGKAFIYYHYADRPYTVSGQNLNYLGSKAFKPSYIYSLQFKTGWNAYANINPATPGESGSLISCTTTLPDETQLQWCFEKH